MKQGDFTQLAQAYRHRAGYSMRVLRTLATLLNAGRPNFRVADVGAGTGKLTENLLALGLDVTAVEPNEAMREEGRRQVPEGPALRWRAGSAEDTGLPSASVDWVLMGSSFHWPDQARALAEFRRILRPGGHFTAVWNPRDLGRSELHTRIEAAIHELAPQIQRVSSGAGRYTVGLEQVLLASGHFCRPLQIEAPHDLHMSPERYLGAWRSVNDIQAQAGPELFARILQRIESEIAGLEEIVVPYRTRSWTVQSVTGPTDTQD